MKVSCQVAHYRASVPGASTFFDGKSEWKSFFKIEQFCHSFFCSGADEIFEMWKGGGFRTNIESWRVDCTSVFFFLVFQEPGRISELGRVASEPCSNAISWFQITFYCFLSISFFVLFFFSHPSGWLQTPLSVLQETAFVSIRTPLTSDTLEDLFSLSFFAWLAFLGLLRYLLVSGPCLWSASSFWLCPLRPVRNRFFACSTRRLAP